MTIRRARKRETFLSLRAFPAPNSTPCSSPCAFRFHALDLEADTVLEMVLPTSPESL